METPLGEIITEAKGLEKNVEEERKQTKSVQSLLEETSVTGSTAVDIESLHQRSMHDINLCIEKIEELSTECKSLLSVIQDLERGNSEFLFEVGNKGNSECELGNTLVKEFEAFAGETDIQAKKPSGEVSTEYENNAIKSAKV